MRHKTNQRFDNVHIIRVKVIKKQVQRKALNKAYFFFDSSSLLT